MTLHEYLDALKGKRAAVIGIGVSNQPLLNLLLEAGIDVTACDKKDRAALGALGDELEKMGCKLRLGPDYLAGLDQDVIFRTPGLHPRHLAEAAARGSVITSEMEVFFDVCPCPILAVTGSDGKTTTTTIIARLLQAAGHTVHLGGNIGRPLLGEAEAIRPGDWAVVELSSFQLLTMRRSPHIAVLTNLAPNHLDVHTDMEEYVRAKAVLLNYQGPSDRAVCNWDNEITRRLSQETAGKVSHFTRASGFKPDRGCWLEGDAVWYRDEAGAREVLPLRDILLPGVHNVENYMAAICAVQGLVGDETIRTLARSFGGVEHRIELVRELDGVRYYNDSIGTSPTRTMACLDSFDQKLILIAGGYDKGVPFTQLGVEIVRQVKALILTGDTAPAIKKAVEEAEGYIESGLQLIETEDLATAVSAAREIAREGDVVVLSPACAAFDRFKNFMERGKVFKQLVNDL